MSPEDQTSQQLFMEEAPITNKYFELKKLVGLPLQLELLTVFSPTNRCVATSSQYTHNQPPTTLDMQISHFTSTSSLCTIIGTSLQQILFRCSFHPNLSTLLLCAIYTHTIAACPHTYTIYIYMLTASIPC